MLRGHGSVEVLLLFGWWCGKEEVCGDDENRKQRCKLHEKKLRCDPQPRRSRTRFQATIPAATTSRYLATQGKHSHNTVYRD